MTRWSFADADGYFTGEAFEGPVAALELNTPIGCVPVPGLHDHLSRRVDLATGEVVDWQPAKPAGDEYTDHEWDDGIKRWRPIETLAGRKRAIAARLNARKTAQIDAGVVYEGHQYQSDHDSRMALLERVMALPAGGPTVAAGTWTDADNNNVPMTRGQLRALLAAMSEQRNSIHAAIRAKKAALEDAGPDDLDAILA